MGSAGELKEYKQGQCMILDAWGWCTGMTQRDGMGREGEEVQDGEHVCIPVGDSC